MTMLALSGVTKAYGALVAVDHVDLEVLAGERHALIGPNGAGKTTLFDLVAGRSRATSGSITFAGSDITALAEHRRARLGIAKTFQQSSLLDGLPAIDNVIAAVQRVTGRARRLWGGVGDADARAAALLADVGLDGRETTPAGALSHGERRQLEVAMALATEPALLLLDEPVAGMSAAERRSFVALVGALPSALTVLLIEHDLDVVFALADRISVLDAGRLLAAGTPDEIRSSRPVQQAYLGRSGTASPPG